VLFVPSWQNSKNTSEEILKRLQSRRIFLKCSALLAASALIVPAAL
jgi:hypothetical protein